ASILARRAAVHAPAAHSAAPRLPRTTCSAADSGPLQYSSIPPLLAGRASPISILRPTLALGERRRRRQLRVVGAQLIQNHVDGPIELLVGAAVLQPGIVVHDDVGIDAVVLHDPFLAVETIAGKLRLVEAAAVDKRQ